MQDGLALVAVARHRRGRRVESPAAPDGRVGCRGSVYRRGDTRRRDPAAASRSSGSRSGSDRCGRDNARRSGIRAAARTGPADTPASRRRDAVPAGCSGTRRAARACTDARSAAVRAPAGEQARHRRLLHELAGVHDRDAVARLREHREVVGDQDHRQPGARGGRAAASRICACVITSRAVMGSSAITSPAAGERHRDHHPLPHAAGELVRIVARAIRRDRRRPPGAPPSATRAPR